MKEAVEAVAGEDLDAGPDQGADDADPDQLDQGDGDVAWNVDDSDWEGGKVPGKVPG